MVDEDIEAPNGAMSLPASSGLAKRVREKGDFPPLTVWNLPAPPSTHLRHVQISLAAPTSGREAAWLRKHQSRHGWSKTPCRP